MPLRALIVEDEPLARDRLRLMLTEHPDVEIVGECADAPDGVRTALNVRPDVLLLDIRLPGADGFAVLEGLRSLEPPPFVVFITAFADHAVRAFDENAVDYLLKPYNAARLARSLERARRAVTGRTSDALVAEVKALTRVLESGGRADSGGGKSAETTATYPDRFPVTVGRRVVFVPVADVEWVEADRNYVCLHTAKKPYVLRAKLADIERQLDPLRFVRVHRSAIVRRDLVRELEPLANGGARVTMASGTVVPVAAPYRDRLSAALGGRADATDRA
jgi:two-component system LytT family response regulator